MIIHLILSLLGLIHFFLVCFQLAFLIYWYGKHQTEFDRVARFHKRDGVRVIYKYRGDFIEAWIESNQDWPKIIKPKMIQEWDPMNRSNRRKVSRHNLRRV